MKLLASGSNPTYWYISELGQDLSSYWQRFRLMHSQHEVERQAIDIFYGIARGLMACHLNSLVHRDVKPGNIVIYDRGSIATPCLIDFGVVWVPEEERITDVGEAVGNKPYSPDIQRNRLDDPPPWIDVFSATQIFQWMLAERDAKHHWQRPIHWRYVRYPQGTTPWISGAVRALGALASLEDVCPKDGARLVDLMNNLFARSNPPTTSGLSQEHLDSMLQGISLGAQQEALKTTRDRETLEACRTLAIQVIEPLIDALKSLESLPRIRLSHAREINEAISTDADPKSNLTVLEYTCSSERGRSFRVSLSIRAFTPSLWPNGGKPSSLENVNAFACVIERAGPNAEGMQFPYKEQPLTVETDGNLMLRSANWVDRLQIVTVDQLRVIFIKMLTDPKAWECISMT
jgi:serine/threonine protein kinase